MRLTPTRNAGFYRQLHNHGAMYWLQCAFSLSAGCTYDLRLIFGYVPHTIKLTRKSSSIVKSSEFM